VVQEPAHYLIVELVRVDIDGLLLLLEKFKLGLQGGDLVSKGVGEWLLSAKGRVAESEGLGLDTLIYVRY